MSDNRTQDESESLFSEEEIENTNPDTNADGTSTSDTNAEESQDELAIDKAQSEAEVQRQKQIDTWADRIEKGEVQLEDLPSNLHWLKPYIESKLNPKKQITQDDIERMFEEREMKKEFQRELSDLKSMSLSADQKQLLNAKFDSLLKGGLNELTALRTAKEIANISDSSVEAKREAMKMPPSGIPPTPKGEVSERDLEKYPPGHPKRLELRKRLIEQQQ